MKVYTDIDSFKNIPNPIVTTGTFDGVHLGHQKIIKRIKLLAKKNKGETVILTFYPHPRMVLFPEDNELKLLSTQQEKIALLESLGVDHLIVYPFSKEFSRLTSVEFVRNVLVNKIKTHQLIIGYNHHFGRNREGSFSHLKEYAKVYGFSVKEIPAVDVDSIDVSSTKIREALKNGNINIANEYLGHPYSIEGIVVKGKQLGRTLGYPTANINIDDKYKLIPSDGIYAVTIEYNTKTYLGMMSIGMNPTVNGQSRTIEVNIFDFNSDIYGEKLKINFVKKLRNEVKFNNLEELTNQLSLDKEETLKVHLSPALSPSANAQDKLGEGE